MGDSLLERWFAAGDSGQFDVFDEVLHPEVSIHAPLGLSTHGPEAEKQVWREALIAMPNIRHEIKEVWTTGSSIAARAVVSATLQGEFAGIDATGESFVVDQGLFAKVKDGQIIEAWEIVDTVSLLRQLGVMPGE